MRTVNSIDLLKADPAAIGFEIRARVYSLNLRQGISQFVVDRHSITVNVLSPGLWKCWIMLALILIYMCQGK